MAKLYYQGHGSYRITSAAGKVIYVDPYAGDGYGPLADLVLVTHQHFDHNRLDLVHLKQGARVITNFEALAGGVHQTYYLDWAKVEATWAENAHHDPNDCVGFILSLDGVSLYCSGDTSKYAAMADLAARHLDYAILPGDGIYNMNLAEAAECAELIGAKHNIIIHLSPDGPDPLFDLAKAEVWTAPNKLIIKPGEEIEL
ncbi:MAG: MBL fold metallo-hydrolase [Coriobacteriales bacterium]|jgi:L-ascorbate metabolism protein UlaG (beta-lactamase superfamily)|nr:MBL fold metallo-hydrolase [Coriobacteriales bacterium]